MIALEDALDDCLAQLAAGGATLDDCLARYPEHALELRHLLAAAAPLQRAATLKPSASFKTRNRAQLIAHIGAHPRRRKFSLPFFPGGLRLAFSLASLVLAFLLVGTVAAQSALPGQPLYSWKRTSESAWRALSPDPLTVDIALSQRRADELVQMRGSDAEGLALQGYREALVQVSTYTDPTEQEAIADSLADQKLELDERGLSVPELEQLLKSFQATTEPALETTSLPATLVPTADLSLIVLPTETASLAPTDTASPIPGASPSPTATATPAPTQTATPIVPTLAVPTQSVPVPTLEIPTVVASVLPPQVATAIASPIGEVGGLIATLAPTLVPDLNLTLPIP